MVIPYRLLPHTVTVAPRAGASAHAPVYGTPVTLRVRVELYTTRVTVPESGETIDAAGRMFARPEASATVTVGARVTYRDRVYTVARVADEHGRTGPSHLEVTLA